MRDRFLKRTCVCVFLWRGTFQNYNSRVTCYRSTVVTGGNISGVNIAATVHWSVTAFVCVEVEGGGGETRLFWRCVFEDVRIEITDENHRPNVL